MSDSEHLPETKDGYDIIVSSTEALYDDYANLKSQTPLGYAPFGLAGIIVNDCDIICGDCATDEELANNDNGAIFGNAEWDYPAPVCEDCQKPLNVDLLVYRSHDPELHFRLRMTEVLGGFADTDCFTIEEIGEKAAERAAEIGRTMLLICSLQRNITKSQPIRRNTATISPHNCNNWLVTRLTTAHLPILDIISIKRMCCPRSERHTTAKLSTERYRPTLTVFGFTAVGD